MRALFIYVEPSKTLCLTKITSISFGIVEKSKKIIILGSLSWLIEKTNLKLVYLKNLINIYQQIL